jgi:hypothetical protein
MKRPLICCVLWAAIMAPAFAAEPAAPAASGKSEMSVGFTPPEKPASGPRPWTREDLYRAQHRHNQDTRLPRCEQDRLLTDKRPCDDTLHGQ